MLKWYFIWVKKAEYAIFIKFNLVMVDTMVMMDMN